MSSLLKAAQAVIVSTLLSAAGIATANAEQRLSADQSKVVDTVNTIFVAARADDVAKFDSIIAPGFYIYDGGARFDGDSIMSFIKAQHAAGKHYEWNITDPDVHINGNMAWIAYVNQGSIGDASGTVNQKWLESAILQEQAGAWKLLFVHSTRVPNAPK